MKKLMSLYNSLHTPIIRYSRNKIKEYCPARICAPDAFLFRKSSFIGEWRERERKIQNLSLSRSLSSFDLATLLVFWHLGLFPEAFWAFLGFSSLPFLSFFLSFFHSFLLFFTTPSSSLFLSLSPSPCDAQNVQAATTIHRQKRTKDILLWIAIILPDVQKGERKREDRRKNKKKEMEREREEKEGKVVALLHRRMPCHVSYD